jgi:hypothetical protein
MRFSQGRTFNTHDTSVSKGDNGRIAIDQSRGVKNRCELSLNALLRFGPKGASAEMVANHLNGRLKANYSASDIRYALNRLVAEGVIRSTSGGRGDDAIYRAGKSALDHWRRLPKEAV